MSHRPFLFWALALALANGLGALWAFARGRRTGLAGAAGEAPGFSRRFLAPALVLLASFAAIAAAPALPAAAARLAANRPAIEAWLLFWSVLALGGSAEDVWRMAQGLRGRRFPVPDLLASILRAVGIVAAGLVILRYRLGFDISTLLASTALLTAVVGFALQGVLSNLMSGMSLHLVRSFRPMDWVSIGGVDGQVTSTNWRETRMRTIDGHRLVLPNSAVASATIHNMSQPDPARRHEVFIMADFDAPPGEVAEALVEAARADAEVLADPAPSAYVAAYRDWGVQYRLFFWTRAYQSRRPIEGRVLGMAWYQFQRRGIRIPLPFVAEQMAGLVGPAARDAGAEADRTRAALLASEFGKTYLHGPDGRPLLRPEDVAALSERLRHVRFARGETIVRQGDAGDACYVILRGAVHGRVEYRDASAAHEFELRPGDLIGEMCLLSGLPRTATLAAAGECDLLEISESAFRTLLALRPDLPEKLSALVSERESRNAEALERLRALENVDVRKRLSRESILARLRRLIGTA